MTRLVPRGVWWSEESGRDRLCLPGRSVTCFCWGRGGSDPLDWPCLSRGLLLLLRAGKSTEAPCEFPCSRSLASKPAPVLSQQQEAN